MAGMPYPPTKTPTDCTDAHRLGGKTQPKDLWASVKSVGGSSTPFVSVKSVNSVEDFRGRRGGRVKTPNINN